MPDKLAKAYKTSAYVRIAARAVISSLVGGIVTLAYHLLMVYLGI
jgi:hypothetical protein